MFLLGGNCVRTARGRLPRSILVAGLKQTESQNHSRDNIAGHLGIQKDPPT